MQPGRDSIGVGVGAVIRDCEGRLFLACRGPEARNEPGTWEFPGGAIEFGEPLEAALRREIREEFGVDIRVEALLHVADHILPEESQHWVSPTCLCRIVSGTPRIREPQKCSRIGWFTPDALPEPLSRVTRLNLQFIFKELTHG